MLTAARPMLAATPDDQVEIPFLRLFEPLLRQSRAQLQSRISVCTQSVSCAALTMLEHSLARTLSDICAETLVLEFSLFRFRHGLFPKVSDPPFPRCALYDDFANKMVGDALANFFVLFGIRPARSRPLGGGLILRIRLAPHLQAQRRPFGTFLFFACRLAESQRRSPGFPYGPSPTTQRLRMG